MNNMDPRKMDALHNREPSTQSRPTTAFTRRSRQAEYDRWVELQASQRSLHAVDLDTASPPRADGVQIMSVPARPKTSFYQNIVKRHEEVRSREIAYANFYGIPAQDDDTP